MIFNQEEELVEKEFNASFESKIKLFKRQVLMLESLLKLIGESKLVKENEYDKYSISVLASIALKSVISSQDRLSKGYIGDSEAVLKRVIECFLAQCYFSKNPDKAKDWVEDKISLGKLEGDRSNLVKWLDKNNIYQEIFPTNSLDFFQDFVYRVGYKNNNYVSHMDFNMVHREVGFDSARNNTAVTTLVLGPKFDKEFMETILNRLMMTLMLEITMINCFFHNLVTEDYNDLFKQIMKVISDVKQVSNAVIIN
ncbi:MAG TPA: hypothetical protein PLI45_01220 [Candidatus Woesebacteria bacterium]|nr:hypothetical protein [Candidatus Woesebacteria bacterium]